MNFLVLHGPNLNLLGAREPAVYGNMTLLELDKKLREYARPHGLNILQSNHEGELIDCLHENRTTADGVLINPAAFTHYSYALRDAIVAVNLPAVEVHLSDIYAREDFRKNSVIKSVCVAQVGGKGFHSYTAGLDILIKHLTS